MQEPSFRRRDLMKFLANNHVSEASAHVLMKRLVEQGKLLKVGYGQYTIPGNEKLSFIYKPSEQEQELFRQIKMKFPFVTFCVWEPSVLVPYMRHIPALGMMFVDVERAAMESVFNFLQGWASSTTILLNPTAKECERYITTDNILIVRPLVNEAPITTMNGITVPTLEKILVDASGDKELTFSQGSELYTIFENAFNKNDVNVSRLLRYAARRNRKENILKIIKTLDS